MKTPQATRSREISPSATVAIADKVSQMRQRGIDVIDFSAGRAAEHTPDYIVQAATAAMHAGDTHQTMARGTRDFRAACAAKLARDNAIEADPQSELIATLGCKQGLFLALMATLDPGDEVFVEDPGFVSYEPEIQYCGGVPVATPLPWSRKLLASRLTPRTRGIVMCSPHNPTGHVPTHDELDVIASFARANDLLIYSDETYERLTWDSQKHVSIATLPGMSERVITLMGLTKSFSMGGWRIGFAYAPEPVIDAMLTVQQHLVTCAGSFTQAGAAAAYAQPPSSSVVELWADWQTRCRHVASTLDSLAGISCSMPQGGFYAWADVSELGEPSSDIAARWLEQQRVAVIPGSAFGPSGEGYVRITCVRSWDELEEGLNRIRKALP